MLDFRTRAAGLLRASRPPDRFPRRACSHNPARGSAPASDPASHSHAPGVQTEVQFHFRLGRSEGWAAERQTSVRKNVACPSTASDQHNLLPKQVTKHPQIMGRSLTQSSPKPAPFSAPSESSGPCSNLRGDSARGEPGRGEAGLCRPLASVGDPRRLS